MKKLLAMILAVVMVVSLLPAAVFAGGGMSHPALQNMIPLSATPAFSSGRRCR